MTDTSIHSRDESESLRRHHMVVNMPLNKAYLHARAERGDPDGSLLEEYRRRYIDFRIRWRGNPQKALSDGIHGDSFRAGGFRPLGVDLETAAVCDLACPFCFRQEVATPDALMSEELANRIIDECAALEIPSLKFNWRGESLMHPKLPAFIDRAKRKGILETIINTNAVRLDEQKCRALIDAGLDLIIYSFDGGTKETYEKNRIGRFGANLFEDVLGNIRTFARVRGERGAVYPMTKIQMISTPETEAERQPFLDLFRDCVDDVTVKVYTEYGWNERPLDPAVVARLAPTMPPDVRAGLEKRRYWQDEHGDIHIAVGRLPCEQPFQRMVISYDGRVSMCCYDWGSQHAIGFLDENAFAQGDRDYERTMQKARERARGYEHITNIRMPHRYTEPPRRVQSLADIWHGAIVNEARRAHCEGRVEDLEVCRHCIFRETYRWFKAPRPQ